MNVTASQFIRRRATLPEAERSRSFAYGRCPGKQSVLRDRFSAGYRGVPGFIEAQQYRFSLDTLQLRMKCPGKKYFKGPKAGQYSCNPLGKNPGDLWVIPNVKHNHPEKTIHPCQFPVELVERLVLALTKPGDLVVDPYMGVESTACAAVIHRRRAAGAETVRQYLDVARRRVELAFEGKVATRPMDRPVYQPDPKTSVARRPPELGYPTLIRV